MNLENIEGKDKNKKKKKWKWLHDLTINKISEKRSK
jgi:hypothetical protein